MHKKQIYFIWCRQSFKRWGDNWESLASKIAPLDFKSLDKAIKAVEKEGGISKIIKNIEKSY